MRVHQPHLRAISLLLLLSAVGFGLWLWLQSQREDPLPTLLWAPNLEDAVVLERAPLILDRLGGGWWWVEATPFEREKLRGLGAHLALAVPQPVARMAGCTAELPRDPKEIKRLGPP